MPASRRSVQVTNGYRARLAAIRARVEATARREWPTIETLDGTRWAERAAQVVAGAQTEATRAASGFLTAYLSSELGRRVRAVSIDSGAYAGLSRDGRPLNEALRSPLITVLAGLKNGQTPEQALAHGWNAAARMVEMDVMHTARTALMDAIDADDRIDGWQRATAGTCGACMALAGTGGPHFEVHPGCQCQPQPVVKGVPDLIPVLTGVQMFERMTREEQDAQFGEDKAEALRAGEITLPDLVKRSRLRTDQRDYITEAPLTAAQ